MRALTLWQPWASLVALGVKTIETRSWSTSYRGPLAIHASKKRPRDGEIGDYVYDDCGGRTGWIAPIHSRDGYTGEAIADWIGDPMPLGAVVATCTLVDVVPTESLTWLDNRHDHGSLRDGGCGGCVHESRSGYEHYRYSHAADVADRLRPYGDFSGRYAWLLADIVPLAEPVPAKGRQGLWKWTS